MREWHGNMSFCEVKTEVKLLMLTYGLSNLYVILDLSQLAGCINCITRGLPSLSFPPTVFLVLHKIRRFLATVFLSIHSNVKWDYMHEKCYLTECRILFFLGN